MLCFGSGVPCGSPSRSRGSDTRQEDPPPKHTHAHKPFVSGHARIAAKCHEYIVFVSSAMESHTCVCSLRLRLAVAHSRLKMVKVAGRIHLDACPTSASSLSVNTYFRSRRCSPDASLPCLHAVHCHALCPARTYLSLSSKKCQQK
jgi:hypothetical protein